MGVAGDIGDGAAMAQGSGRRRQNPAARPLGDGTKDAVGDGGSGVQWTTGRHEIVRMEAGEEDREVMGALGQRLTSVLRTD